MLTNNDLYIVIGAWTFAIVVIIMSIVFDIQNEKWWKQPYILGATISAGVIIGYSLYFERILLSNQIIPIIVDKLPILFLIISFAYIAISIDQSGFFDYCAKKIVIWSNGNGNKLFIFLFTLISLLTLVTSNDVIILTMTPIIIYVCRNLGIKNMIPYLLAQFFAANILSMGLYIGSPTNVVIAEAINISFAQYSLKMFLPAIICGVSTLLFLFLIFKKSKMNSFVSTFKPPNYQNLTLTAEMKIKVIILTGLLIFATLTSLPDFSLKLWHICLIFALINAIVDIILLHSTKMSLVKNYKYVANRLPWGIIPFAISFFIIVEALNKIGISNIVAHQLKNLIFIIDDNNSVMLWTSILFGQVSAFFVNIMNDIPATVFLSDILVAFQKDTTISNQLFDVILKSTLVGVNAGCNMTLIGALAGLMWFSILKKNKNKGEIFPTIRKLTFMGIPLMILIITIGSVVSFFQTIIH